MLKNAMLLLLTMHLCIGGQSQNLCTCTLSGQITGAIGNPLPGAVILLSPGEIGQTTDVEGRYAFKDLCPGTYKIRVHYVGYKELSLRVKVTENETKNFTLEESATELSEVVIHHHDATNVEHATNFLELDERKLAENAGKTLGETLKGIPGVASLQTGPGIFKPIVHGVHSQRLLILNHGIRHEGQQWGAEHAPEIDPFIASNVVVIKDASAIKYGADALGGVIVVNPAQLPEAHEIGGTVTTVLQSNGRSGTISGMLEGGIKQYEGWGWRIQGTAKRTGDFHTPDYALTNTGMNELNFSVATGYHAKKLGLDLFFSRFQSKIGILRGASVGNLDDLVNAMERDVPLYTEKFSYDIQAPRQEVSHNLIKLNGHVGGESGEWRFQYGFQNNNRSEFGLRIGDLTKTPAVDLKLNTHTLDLEWETHHSTSRTFSVGLNTLYQRNINLPGTQRIPFIPNFVNISGGAFAVSKFFIDQWTINAGVRYDYRNYSVKGFDYKNSRYNARFNFNNVSASVGVTRQMAIEQTLSLNVSTSWRPPHVSELYSMGTHQSAGSIEYGLMLDAETNEVRDIDVVEVSSEQALKTVASYRIRKDRLQFTITPFANYIFNYIYLRPQGITKSLSGVYPCFRYHQTDALFLGADLDAAIKIHNNLMASPGISLLRARDVVNKSAFLFIPTSRYSLDLRYDRHEFLGVKNAYIASGFQYVTQQVFSPRVVTVREIKEADENDIDPFQGNASIFDFAEAPDGYLLWSASAGFSIRNEKVQYDFRLSAENLLNQRYRDYTNRLRYYADDLGRNVMFSIKCIF